MRWFLNKFPAAELKGKPEIKAKKFLSEGNTYGVHEIIVETSHHKSQLADLPVSDFRQLLEVYKVRFHDLSKLKNIKYVQVFKNHGKDAGTSLVHSHSQIVAVAQVPTLIQEEIDASKRYKKCPYCEILNLESK